MKLVNTIIKQIKCYPTLFTDRESCLNHLFLVIGNGYHWENGQLVDRYDRKRVRALQDFETEFEIWRNDPETQDIVGIRKGAYEFKMEHGVGGELGSLGDYLREGFRKDYDRQVWALENAAAVANGRPYPPAPDRHIPLLGESREPYPISPGYSPALCLPDDAQLDWIEGAVEALKWAMDVPITSYSNRGRGDEEVETRYRRNQLHAANGLAEIAHRFEVF